MIYPRMSAVRYLGRWTRQIYLLDPVQANKSLEANELRQSPSGTESLRHVLVKSQNSRNRSSKCDGLYDCGPEISEFGVEIAVTVCSGNFSRLGDNGGNGVDDRELEDE